MVIDDRADTIQLNAAIVEDAPTDDQLRTLHKTIKAVSNDIELLSFNTAIARMMEFVNYFTKASKRPRAVVEPFVLMLSPFAPHLAEELWKALGHEKSLAYEAWPVFDEALTKDSSVEIPVQIKGKVRSKVSVAPDADKATIEQAARDDARIQELLEGKEIVKVVVVPGRLVNFVTK